jgi:hypothetical protein
MWQLTSAFPSWANFIEYTFSTPSLTTIDARSLLVSDSGPFFSVNQILFPTPLLPLTAFAAFRFNDGASPGPFPVVNLLLTGNSLYFKPKM